MLMAWVLVVKAVSAVFQIVLIRYRSAKRWIDSKPYLTKSRWL